MQTPLVSFETDRKLRGQVAVLFAILLPVFMILIIGMINMSMTYLTRMRLMNIATIAASDATVEIASAIHEQALDDYYEAVAYNKECIKLPGCVLKPVNEDYVFLNLSDNSIEYFADKTKISPMLNKAIHESIDINSNKDHLNIKPKPVWVNEKSDPYRTEGRLGDCDSGKILYIIEIELATSINGITDITGKPYTRTVTGKDIGYKSYC